MDLSDVKGNINSAQQLSGPGEERVGAVPEVCWPDDLSTRSPTQTGRRLM